MVILVDPPRWPAHGTVFCHLVSDASLDELHAFADDQGVLTRAFDHDHYDVPASRYDDLVAAGAVPVRERELVARLIAGGLRVRAPEKTPGRITARAAVIADWERYDLPDPLRDELLGRWSEPHRHYHDLRHLAACLASLDALGCETSHVRLAAWFHDAVYEAVPGRDEESSAVLAEERLAGLLPRAEVEAVARLVRMTTHHDPSGEDEAQLSDADLSILGLPRARYDMYVRDVRGDYAHLPESAWRAGRSAVLGALLGRPRLFHTATGADRWEETARANLRAELARWSRVPAT